MCKACSEVGLPEPHFEEYQGFRVTFRRDIFTEEYLRNLGLNERHIKALKYAKEKGKITNKDYQIINSVSRQTATLELGELTNKRILERVGSVGKGTIYQLTKLPNK
ncbi:MAG: hypothetical protein GTO45_27750 [Candidatus Aminicenantes bacterium]|nr:hypothetical protein [Candidatus Aminicenantes bacterium]NIM82596.1 hypothetical protein [Candidatus Aminicenantes bacterium]NIN21964.1 hypothetical protein [Candidatus Aminicenantes bacterium]NIN45726.1 hypothetical protein [Candidatus Aminicenantes bacterium]NIN88564.1 hypothetical protein [Candidatus Aminicenantes bacterium]